MADLIETTVQPAEPDGPTADRDPRGEPGRPAPDRRPGALPQGLCATTSWSSASARPGPGKTYLAVAMAVAALRRGKIKKIVLVRPAVEAGEHLGFLPGDLEAKINPYLRPLLDALHDLMDYDQIRRYMGNDLIEIAPLAYMRGRTLNDAVIILDEGQNATVPQMKMFLTRMGQNARIVVTGDITQVDLPPATVSGLADAVERLRDVPGVGIVDPRPVGHRPAPAGAGDRQRLRRDRAGPASRSRSLAPGTAPNRPPAAGPPASE